MSEELTALLNQLVQNSKEQQERHDAALLEAQTKADEKFAALIASIKQPGQITLKPSY